MIARALILFAAVAACASQAAAQDRDWGAYRVDADRAVIETAISNFEAAARSSAYSPELRGRAREEAAAARARLSDGDLQVGDRIVLYVEGELALSDTFTVSSERTILLPTIGEVSLTGVLRSELNARVREEIGRLIRDPVVRARSYVRVSVTGEVTEPGFYLMAPETPLSEAIMAAGGLTSNAKISGMRVKRNELTVMEGDALQRSIGRGATVAQLALRSGDEVVVPRRSIFAPGQIGSTVALLSGLVFAINAILP